MEEQNTADDQSHYEISLTASQAFIAFVLLLLSLGAAFAFGLMLGKGQADERLVVQKETPVVTEAGVVPKKNAGRIVELGVETDDFEATDSAAATTDTTASTTVIEEAAGATATGSDPVAETATTPHEPAATDTVAPAEAAAAVPVRIVPAAATPAARPATPVTRVLAQLLSTGDQKVAEALAVKLINRGFTTAYVERGSTDKGPVYRVRVRFNSETEARAAEPKLREFSRDVWITAG